MSRLITDTGRLDRAEIIREIGRRCAEQFERIGRADRSYHENHVRQEARSQQWPWIEAAVAAEWTAQERARELELLDLADGQAPTQGGNRRFEELNCQAAMIREAVFARAMARFEAPAVAAE